MKKARVIQKLCSDVNLYFFNAALSYIIAHILYINNASKQMLHFIFFLDKKISILLPKM